MTEQEPTDNMILMRIVEVIGRRKLHADQGVFDENSSRPNVVILGDQYTTGQAGAVGPNSSSQGNSFVQVWNREGATIDLTRLAAELAKVRGDLKRNSTGDAEQDFTIGEIAQAEISAKKDDGPGVMRHLHTAGEWALDVAKSSGAEVAVTAMEAAIGLK
jgi:hypothetical protein